MDNNEYFFFNVIKYFFFIFKYINIIITLIYTIIVIIFLNNFLINFYICVYIYLNLIKIKLKKLWIRISKPKFIKQDPKTNKKIYEI